MPGALLFAADSTYMANPPADKNIKQDESDSIIPSKTSGLNFQHDTFLFKYQNILPEKWEFHPAPLNETTAPKLESISSSCRYTNINISSDSMPQNEPTIKISRKDPDNIVCAWRDFRLGLNPLIRRIGYSYSTDGGTTWFAGKLVQPFDKNYKMTSDPVLCADTSGNFYLSSISIDEKEFDGIVTVYKSTNNGVSFDKVTNVSQHKQGKFFDDKEYMTCDHSRSSPYRNTLYITWTRYNQKDSSAKILMAKSGDEGKSWSKPFNVFNPSKGDFGSGSMPVTGPNGELYAIFAGVIEGVYGIYISVSTNGGKDFSKTILIDTASYPGLPSIAADISGGTRNGTLYAVWAPYEEAGQNILFKFSTDIGKTWRGRKIINNSTPGDREFCTQPAISVDEKGNIYIIYYQSKTDRTVNEVYLAVSTDGGENFTNELLSSQLPPAGSRNMGHYISIDTWSGKVIPVWTDNRNGIDNSDIYTAEKKSVIAEERTAPESQIKASRVRENILIIGNASEVSYMKQATQFKVVFPPQMIYERFNLYDILGRKREILEKNISRQRSYEELNRTLGESSFVYFIRFFGVQINVIHNMMLNTMQDISRKLAK